MKHCLNCFYHEIRTEQLPNGQFVRGPYCKNVECSDPVDGSAMPCALARREPAFCGIQARHWKRREEAPKEPAQVIDITEARKS